MSLFPSRIPTAAAVTIVATVLANSHAVAVQEDGEFAAGLLARYSNKQGEAAERIDKTLSFAWGESAPDRRLSPGEFSASWRGYLKSQARGNYELRVYAAGKVKITLNGEVLLNASADRPVWLAAKPVELPFDWHALEIAFDATVKNPRLSLFWSGPEFQLEPVSPSSLYHDRERTPADDFQRGELLMRAGRCANCHQIPGERPAHPAPSLDHLPGHISRDWLVDWLSSHDADFTQRQMPSFGLSEAEAADVAAYLLGAGTEDKLQNIKDLKGDTAQGETLFHTLGCLACHRQGDLGNSGQFGGGDLTHIGDKRPMEFFVKWLHKPAAINEHHRMPVFDLSGKERLNLAAYLATLQAEEKPVEKPAGSAQRGKLLVARHRCSSCHQLPEKADAVDEKLALGDGSNWDRGCLADTDDAKQRPSYQLPRAHRRAIQAFISQVREAPPKRPERGEILLQENNCLACHARDSAPGIAERLPAVAKSHPKLTSLIPAMTPPPLNSVGDKLHRQALEDSIRRPAIHREWLKVRMPTFSLRDDEVKALVAYFVDADRIPPRTEKALPHPDEAVMRLAGARLVTPDGFGCTSCHQVGDVVPPGAPLNTRGPKLSMMGQRIRREWFDRWVRNPARMVPRMEMPSVQLPVRGVLADDLDAQLAAVWHALHQPGFQPPLPNPVRVVRRSGIEERGERVAVLTDVLRMGDNTYLKPMLVGLPNRHNFLFDLESSRLAAWWIGDLARQRTEGKTWYWEAAGSDLLNLNGTHSDLQLVRDGKVVSPQRIGQFTTECDAWEHTADGLAFRHRLKFPSDGGLTIVSVSQSLRPVLRDNVSGISREIQLAGVPVGWQVRLKATSKTRAKNQSLNIAVAEPKDARLDDDGYLVMAPVASADKPVVLGIEYLTSLPIDRFPVIPPKLDPPQTEELIVIPGFEAIRLAIADALMPTAMAWKPDGSLVVTSLKGRVWLARDTNGDGLEDDITAISDELAAPFGVAAFNDHIDVINKYALLRLSDNDGDGRIDRTQTVASGWGHTTDYHDWTVGLPRDDKGNYYVAMSCQQDKRSLAAAHLRGTVCKLVPREPTVDDTRLFETKLISGGHRFPIGIARNRAGAMFVTDNQGNYNPFNELNHVTEGKRYGFINAWERKDDFKPPLTPPAIDIPHPWTRSVNGICFLESEHGVFGPFEGHLIGCEYDTRRLIRMSVQRVGDAYQGAAYPFSYDKPKSGPPIIGPIACAVAPDGDLYIGSIRDSGWGGANNIGELVRVRALPAEIPAGIAEVRATADGFIIDFTKPVDSKLASQTENYNLSSYTRVSTPAYGGSDKNRRTEKIARVTVSEDSRRATIRLPEMRAGYVYELKLKNVAGSDLFFPAEAHYTLRRIPD